VIVQALAVGLAFASGLVSFVSLCAVTLGAVLTAGALNEAVLT